MYTAPWGLRHLNWHISGCGLRVLEGSRTWVMWLLMTSLLQAVKQLPSAIQKPIRWTLDISKNIKVLITLHHNNIIASQATISRGTGVTSQSICLITLLQCASENAPRCITSDYVCDFIGDCAAAADEQKCGKLSIPETKQSSDQTGIGTLKFEYLWSTQHCLQLYIWGEYQSWKNYKILHSQNNLSTYITGYMLELENADG